MPNQDPVSHGRDDLRVGTLFRAIRTALHVASRWTLGCLNALCPVAPARTGGRGAGATGWGPRALMLISILLTASCARFTYDELPVSSPGGTPFPTPADVDGASSSTVTETPVPAEPQGEAAQVAPTVQGPTVLRIHPSVVDIDVDETYLVQVWIDDVQRLHSIELQITFDPRYVRVEDADPDLAGVQIGAGVIPLPAQIVQNEADNDAGRIVYHAAQSPGDPASGSGMVASFTARGLADGGSPLSFDIANLQASEAEPLPTPQQIDGMVVIGTGDAADVDRASADDDRASGDVLPEPTAAAIPPTQESPATTTETQHIVQPGENLFRIALRYGTTVDAIAAANDLPSSNSIQTGQVLIIPASPPIDADTYLVQPDDTLYSIARRFNTTVEELAALNGLAPPYTIEVGQALVVRR